MEVLSSRRTYYVAFAAVLTFLYLRMFLLPAVPFIANGDEILFFSRALRIVHGQVLYRDFFELVPPGTDLLYASVFKVIGLHAWIMPAWHIALGLALWVAITSIAQKMVSGISAFLPASMFLVFAFSYALDATHHWYSTLAALAAVSVVIRMRGLRRLIISGFLCGIAALFTQTQGGLAFVAVVAYLLVERRETKDISATKTVAGLLLPFAVLCSAVIGYYVYRAGAHRVFFDLVTFPVKDLSGPINSPRTYLHEFPSVRRPPDVFLVVPFLLVYAFVPYFYFLSAYQLWRNRTTMRPETRRQILLLTFVGAALFVAVSSGPRFFRICTVSPPAFLIVVWMICKPGRTWGFARVAFWCLTAFYAILLPIHRQTQWHGTLMTRIGKTAFLDPEHMREVQWLEERTHPHDTFFDDSMLAMYLQLVNPTHAEFVNGDEFSQPEDVREIVRTLQEAPPRFIMLNPGLANGGIHDHSAPFYSYVRENYRLAEVFRFDRSAWVEEMWEYRGDVNNSGPH